MNYRLVGGLVMLSALAIGLCVQRIWIAASPTDRSTIAPRNPTGPIKLSESGQWQSIPEFLANATILENKEPNSPQLHHVATRDGVILLAASWTYDGNRTDETWPPECQTLAQLRKDGWIPVGKMANSDGDRYYVFRHKVSAGEELRIQTRLKNPGILMSVPESDVATVLQAESLVPENRKTLLEVRLPADGSGLHDAGSGPGTLSLHMSEPDLRFGQYSRLGLLLRQIVLQGVALAGREELGLVTRDISLRELATGSGEQNTSALEVVAVSQPLNELLFGVFQQRRGQWDAIFDDDLRFPSDNLLERITTAIESRTRNELVSALKSSGFEPHARPISRDSAEVPSQAVELAAKLNIPAIRGAAIAAGRNRRAWTIARASGSRSASQPRCSAF